LTGLWEAIFLPKSQRGYAQFIHSRDGKTSLVSTRIPGGQRARQRLHVGAGTGKWEVIHSIHTPYYDSDSRFIYYLHKERERLHPPDPQNLVGENNEGDSVRP